MRDRAAYVPPNAYGYMALMSDYTFLEDVGRRVGDWGREIVQGGYAASWGSGGGRAGRGRGGARDGRGRGHGRGGAHGKPASKREVLKMQLDMRDIELELLPNGMERRTLNQSTWDFKYAFRLSILRICAQRPKYTSPFCLLETEPRS